MDTMPSKPIHFFDVPEVKAFSAEYFYNFFVPDETIDESGNEILSNRLSPRFLRKGSADLTNLNARVPRYVKFAFSFGDTKRPIMNQRSLRRGFFMTDQQILEALNSGKIVTEDEAAESRYKSLCLGNQSVDFDLENFMRLSLNRYVVDESSIQDAAKQLSEKTDVNSNFISRKMVPPSLNEKPSRKKSKQFNKEEKRQKSQVQLNTAYAPMMLRKSVDRGLSLYDKTLVDNFLTSVSEAPAPTDFEVTEDENIFDIAVLDQEKAPSNRFVSEAGVVGVIIEKFRIFKGKKYPMPVVVMSGRSPSNAYDTQVAYGQTYEYSVRTLAKFRVPATMPDGRSYIQTFLVASKPSQPVRVTLSENRAPEPPQDVNYYYEYDSESLYVTWAPPVNPQRDVKYYQVFRRSSLQEPFELIAHLDFDNSVVRSKTDESIDSSLITSHPDMPTYFIDSEFSKDSSYIYALVAVDARQISSTYSTQVKVSFDNRKNKIKKEFVCYSGAPKQYPNWTIKQNFFVDSMKDSSHSNVNIYFNPEAYTLIRSDGEIIPAFYSQSMDPLAKYVFQFINTDRLLEQKFEVIIDDSNFRKDMDTEQALEQDDDE